MNIKNLFLLSLLAGICSIASAAEDTQETMTHPKYPGKVFRMAKTFPGSKEEHILGAEAPFGLDRKAGTGSITKRQALKGIRDDLGKYFRSTRQQLQLYDRAGNWRSPDNTPYNPKIHYIALGAVGQPYSGEIKSEQTEIHHFPVGGVWDDYYKGKGPGYSGHERL